MNVPKSHTLLVGGGHWANRLFQACRMNGKVNIGGVITKNRDFLKTNFHLRRYDNIQEAFAKQQFDSIICACLPEKQERVIFSKQFSSIPTLLEKPLVVPNFKEDSSDLKSRLFSIINRPYLVNHFHLFHPGYLEFKASFDPLDVEEIQITEGGWGPFRSFSSLFDWGPHAAGVALDLLGENWSILGVTRQCHSHTGSEIHSSQICFLIDRGKTKKATLNFGNGFQEKTRTISSLLSSGEKKTFDLMKWKQQQRSMFSKRFTRPQDALDRILETFGDLCSGNQIFWPNRSVNIAIQSTLMLNEVQKYIVNNQK